MTETAEALRQTIENTRRQLEATPGLTPEMVAQMLAPLQAQITALEQSQPTRAVFAQQEQNVTTQSNIAGDVAAPILSGQFSGPVTVNLPPRREESC